MKANLFDKTGKQAGSVDLPKQFDVLIREDIAQKCYEAYKLQNRFWYSPHPEAGRRHSASGTISHRRHEWKGHYGKGISRVPRKAMWRRGTQFYWIATEVSGTRGGRSVHAPSGMRRQIKLNKKELMIALNSAIASTASKSYISKRYETLSNVVSPVIIESIPNKTKELLSALKLIFGDSIHSLVKSKSVRAGKVKNRGRRFKSNAGLLIVTGSDEKVSAKGFDVKPAKNLEITDLYPLGRITLYTKSALKEMESIK
jgi:ribosomal protein L4